MNLNAITLAITRPGGVLPGAARAWDPLSLFTTGVNGGWYDPSDMTTLFQDAAGTTLVTAVEQPVGLMLDKSGRGNHAFNPSGNSANFPMLKQDEAGRKYLNFNGTNQWLRTNSIDFSYGDKMFVSAGVRKLSDAPTTELLELSVSYSTNNGTFAIFHPDVSGTSAFVGKGTLSAYYSPTLASAPSTSVLSMSLNIAGTDKQSAVIPRINGIVSQSSGAGTTLGTGNFGNYPLYIGARAGTSLWFNGRLYGMVVAGKQASASEITSTETYLNQKTGAY